MVDIKLWIFLLGNIIFKSCLLSYKQALAQELDRPSRPITGIRQPNLISYRDEMARRMHLLKAVNGVDPWGAEMNMLRKSPLLEKLRIPRASTKVAKERAARLQELN